MISALSLFYLLLGNKINIFIVSYRFIKLLSAVDLNYSVGYRVHKFLIVRRKKHAAAEVLHAVI